MRFGSKFLCFCLLAWGAERFCHKQTDGFTINNILAPATAKVEHALTPPTPEKAAEIGQILDQPFTFMKSGGQTYAFLSQDGKYVLKFFKNHHLRTIPWIQPQEKQEIFFQSCKIAYQEMHEETALLYTQLNRSAWWNRKITLVDKIGISYQVELDELRFMLQKRATLAFPRLKELVKQGKKEEAKSVISSILNLLALRSQKGVKDLDGGLKRNIGLVENHAIEIDIGSFSKEPSLVNRQVMREELKEKSSKLSTFLRKKDLELWHYYNERLEKVVQEKGK